MKHNIDRITKLLGRSEKFSKGCITYFEELDSTNSWLLAQPHVDGRVCLAEQQLQGKGRRGKPWVSPPSSGVFISIGWEINNISPDGLSLVSGLAVAQALQSLGVRDLQLKWPNDIYVGGIKLGGILVEISGTNCVIGIGINVNMPRIFDNAIDQSWIDLNRLGYQIDRDKIVAELLLNHEKLLSQFFLEGFETFVEPWNARHIYQNQMIEVIALANSYVGTALGVDSQGALLVSCGGQVKRVLSGEISIRKNQGIESR